MANKWSSETTIKFIQEYKTHECLWNFRSALYKDRNRRDAAYRKLVEVMNISDLGVAEVKNKIKNLRSTYNQEKKKAQDSKHSGAGKSTVYESSVKWLKEMEPTMFIGEKRETLENLSEEGVEQVEDEVGVCGDQGSVRSLATGSQSSKQAGVGATLSSAPSPNAPPNKKKKGNINPLLDAVQELKNVHAAVNNADDEDSYDAFGNSVATQLRKLSEEKALLAQKAIQNILTDYGIEDIRERKHIASRSTLSRPSPSTSTASSILYSSSPSPLPQYHQFHVSSDENTEFLVLQPPRRNISPINGIQSNPQLSNQLPSCQQSFSPPEPANDTDKLASLIHDSFTQY